MGSDNSKTISTDSLSVSKKINNHIKIVTYNLKMTSFSENKFNNVSMYLTYEKKNIVYCIQ